MSDAERLLEAMPHTPSVVSWPPHTAAPATRTLALAPSPSSHLTLATLISPHPRHPTLTASPGLAR